MAESDAFMKINYLRTELAVLAGVVDDQKDPVRPDAIELVAGMAAMLDEFMETHYGDGDDATAP